MMKAWKKYEAAKQAAERWLHDFECDFRTVALRYRDIVRDSDGYEAYRHQLPDDVENIYRDRGSVTVSGTSSCRGCSRHESFTIPERFVMADPDERELFFAELTAEIAAKKVAKEQKQKADQDARDRAEWERLQERFGNHIDNM